MPVVRSRYVANNSDMRKHMMGAETQDAATDAAGDIMNLAIELSPRSSRQDKEHYQDKFHVEKTVVTIQDGPYNNPRRAAEVVNTAAHAAAVEFGDLRVKAYKRRAPRRPLGKAGRRIGDYKGGPPE